ncbi:MULTISPECIES: M23 family metallopeptidase [Streptomyces]|uniref:M23 family metallopeptidase n=1 Tax=Streptomyces venezuelae TaxID=54571 RepID=UPI0016874F58|nr:M23 family metallopeptidase [Streptomyces venezuelae]
MNDQHPHAGYVGDDAHTTGSFAVDPLFGAYPAGQTDHSGQWDFGQYGMTGQYDTAGQQQQYDTTGQWNTTGQWDTSGQWQSVDQYGTTATHTAYDTAGQQYDTTGQWDASAWNDAQQTGRYETVHAAYAAQGTGGTSHAGGYEAYDATGQWAAPAFATETGAYDATAWNQAAPEAEAVVPQQYTPQPEHTAEFAFDYAHEQATEAQTEYAYADELVDVLDDSAHGAAEPAEEFVAGPTDEFVTESEDEFADEPVAEAAADPYVELRTETPLAGRPVRRGAGSSRGRRRTPAKRSALLTVAVPSACVMGVAGIAAASVSGLTNPTEDGGKKDSTTTLAAADPGSVKQVAANSALDTQLAALSEDARDFGDRASRTQERIDLRVRQEAEKKKREEEAARKEALRPKFSLPVELHRLSARFGQSGVNWMSVHTGIDFPVQTGTPVMAATDGTVRTQINSAYGNMVIVTAPDGTETWYCHLSSAKIRYGQVKAGDVIAYSGDTGNSTGPHLHFEVRPGGGYAIDPLAWLRSHGLDPTS